MPLWRRILIGPVKIQTKNLVQLKLFTCELFKMDWQDSRLHASEFELPCRVKNVIGVKPEAWIDTTWLQVTHLRVLQKKFRQSDLIQCAIISQNMSEVILISASVSLVYRGRSISTISICWDWEFAERKCWQPNCVHTCRLFQAYAKFTLNLARTYTQHNAADTLNVSPGIIKPEKPKHVDAEAPCSHLQLSV